MSNGSLYIVVELQDKDNFRTEATLLFNISEKIRKSCTFLEDLLTIYDFNNFY
jgi:hypothetical protein